MAAIILAGGQKHNRLILPHSKVMVHEPLISGSGVSGSATSMRHFTHYGTSEEQQSYPFLCKRSGFL